MKRVTRGVLFGALLAIAGACLPVAQSSVFLAGMDARRVNDKAIIELQTTGQADFTLDRISADNAITLWSSAIELDPSFSEIPLDLNKPEIADLITGVSMVAGKRGSGIRVYLTPAADPWHAGIIQSGKSTLFYVPALAADAGVTSTESTMLAANPPASDAASYAGGSFQLPLADSVEVNFQALPDALPDEANQSDGDAGNVDTTGMVQDMTQIVGEMLSQMGQQIAGGDSAPVEASFSTPSAPYAGQYQSPAQVAMLDNGIELRSGKEMLSRIVIELFEIINTPLDQALTLLVAPTNLNIIVDSSVGTNAISLSFKDKQTDLKSSLDLITKVYGLEYVVQANTIVVASRDKMAGKLVMYEPRLFVLSFADPLSVKDMLVNTGLVAEGQVEIYKGEEKYPEVNDSTFLSTESESSTTEIKPIETNLSSTPRNAVLVKALPDDMPMIAMVISQLDRKPKVIELEVKVCEAGESALRDLGLELNNNAATALPTGTTWTEQPSPQIGTDGTLKDAIEAFTIGSFHRSPLSFIATLNTQIQDGKVEILAQPTLNTVEGKQAIYFAGERIPYIAKVSQAGNGATQIEVDFLNVGVTLNFKPRLDADGKLTIDVNPIVSSLLEFRIIGSLIEAPRTSSRQTATTVRVADGEPFVLAGLITETERATITKVPLLGDLPMVGKLFRNKDLKGERTEIIIVVTPHIHE